MAMPQTHPYTTITEQTLLGRNNVMFIKHQSSILHGTVYLCSTCIQQLKNDELSHDPHKPDMHTFAKDLTSQRKF
jgi:hypothetical protein